MNLKRINEIVFTLLINFAFSTNCINHFLVAEAFGDHGGEHGGSNGLAFLEEDDDYSSFVMPEKFDFDVIFPYNSGPLGLTISDALFITSIKDNYAADLTGMLRVGDQLLAINDEKMPLSNINGENKTHHKIFNVNEKLKILERNNHKQWFYLRFRPSVFERRERAKLYDVNVTIQQGEKLGLLLSSDLKILKIEQRPNLSKENDNNSSADMHSDTSIGAANLVPGDQLIMINDRNVVTKKLNDVLPILKGISATTMNNNQNNRKKSLKLRFRPPLEVREQRKLLIQRTDKNVNFNDRDTFTVTFVDKGPIGINFNEKLVVEGFGLPDGYEIEDDAAEDGDKIDSLIYFPAERTGHVIIGDRLVSVNGEEIKTVEKANELLNVPVKSKRLHCRGGVHCGIEIVRNAPDVRMVTFAIGRRDRRSVHTNNDKYSNAGAVVEEVALNQLAKQRQQEKSIYKVNNDKKKSLLLAKKATNAYGVPEHVFYAKRGIIDVVDSENVDIGSFDFSTALFGGPLWCKHHEIYVPNPDDACEELLDETELRNKYVLVNRGRCYFSTKAIHAQYAGAAGLIVIDTEENKGNLPKRMPGAENDRHLIKIPSIMISYRDGQKIINALNELEQMKDGAYRKISSVKVRGTLRTEENGPNSICKYENAEHEIDSSFYDNMQMPSASTKLHEQGGNIEVLNSNGQMIKRYEYLSAKFGKNLLLKPMTVNMKVATPIKACSDIQNDVKGTVVLIQRGKCSLVDKIERAGNAGAVAALIINNKNGLDIMETWDQKFRPYYVKSKHNVSILSGMITKQAGVELVEMLHDVPSNKNIVARLTSSGAHVKQWEELNALFDIDTWPIDPSGRAQLYLDYAKKNNPNVEFGSNERFQSLQLARKIVETHYANIKLREKLLKERQQQEAAEKNTE
eukprot:g5464.t1